MKLAKKGYCIIALIICSVMLIPVVSITTNGRVKGNREKDSRRIAMNEVAKANQNQTNNYNQYSDYGVKGYSQDEVAEAKMYVDRIMYQLQEITLDDSNSIANPAEDIKKQGMEKDRQKDDVQQYMEIQQKINTKKAVYFLLKLKKEFNGYQGVFDEYLFSLQIGIELDTYITDKKEYLKEKKEKSLGVDTEKLITTSKIESFMLQVIQKRNQKKVDEAVKKTDNSKLKVKEAVTESKKIEAPVPDVNKIRPDNPTEEVNKEINDIKNDSFGVADKQQSDIWGIRNEKK